MPAALKLYFRCCIEYWENPLLNKNYPVAISELSDKYWGLVFRDIYDAYKFLYTVSSAHMEYEKGRKFGWTILAEPFYYDGTNLD